MEEQQRTCIAHDARNVKRLANRYSNRRVVRQSPFAHRLFHCLREFVVM